MVEEIQNETTDTEIVHGDLPTPKPRFYKKGGIPRAWYYIDGSNITRARYMMQQHLGRQLRSDEEVHHINGHALDDRIENLKIVSHEEHNSIHHLGSKADYSIPLSHLDSGCIISKMIGKYGPYLYRVRRVGKSKQIWTYLGRADGLLRNRPHKNIVDSEEVID